MDLLTTAYFAFGIRDAFDDADLDEGYVACIELFGGELGFVQACLDVGFRNLDDTVITRSNERGHLFVYEVAQPFGQKVAAYVLGHYVLPSTTTAQIWIEELLK